MTAAETPHLELKFGGRLVEQLGAQMYPSATATVAELISNSWDADARNVWVQMPYGDWEDGEIVVLDDGIGMDVGEAQSSYLIVGRNRRAGGRQRTDRQRLVHGRKGIGKLAAFGTAGILEVKTRKKSAEEVAFRLDYDRLRLQDPDKPYIVEPSEDPGLLVNPTTGAPLLSGTRIRLSNLRLKRRLDSEQFARSMARRFALNEHEMSVFINGEKLLKFEVDLQYRFPPDGLPPGVSLDGDWAIETLSGNRSVSWWIGFTDKPIKDDTQQGVSIIVRDRLAQRPFMFEAGGGTADQLGQEYLVGEVKADWIDDEDGDSENDADFIQSNRDQLQLEDRDLADFLEWGRQRVRWALSMRGDLRRKAKEQSLEENEGLTELLEGRSKREVSALRRVAAAVARLPEAGDSDVVKVMQAVIGARENETTRDVARDLSLASPEDAPVLVSELAEIESARLLASLDARIEALGQLRAVGLDAASSWIVSLVTTLPGLFNPGWEGYETTESVVIDDGLSRVSLRLSPYGSRHCLLLAHGGGIGAGLADEFERALESTPGQVTVVTPEEGDFPEGIAWDRWLGMSLEAHELWHHRIRQRSDSST